MRANIADYDMWSPTSLGQALKALDETPEENRPFAGGTDLMVLLEAGVLPPGRFMNLWSLDELRGMHLTSDAITLGALTTYSDIRSDDFLSKHYSMMVSAAKETAAIAIQNRGTLGGNIMNASPAADLPPVLLVYDAEIQLQSTEKSYWLPYNEFHLGYKSVKASSKELLTAVRIPRKHVGWTPYYKKVGTRKAQAISKICFAGNAQVVDGVIHDIRIALGSVAPVPLRCTQTEDTLRGEPISASLIEQAKRVLEAEISPISDIRSSADYRRRVSTNLFCDMMRSLDGA